MSCRRVTQSIPTIFILVLFCSAALFVSGQSQPVDGQIEGTVVDANGSAVAQAVVTAENVQTGVIRTTATNDDGVFRVPFASTGAYTLTVAAAGFKRAERRGVNLAAGQTASIEFLLEPGSPDETVVVTSDAAIADAAKFVVGRQLNSRDMRNLPLIARNPYNFILLQSGVNGRTVINPVAIDLSVSGLRRRVGYKLDGSDDNMAGTTGFRMNIISENFVKEMQLLTSGYPAEFGSTAGAIVNVLTPAGSNERNGTVNLIYRPAAMASRPFGARQGGDSNVGAYGGTASLGGPVIPNRWHYYSGYEWTRRNSIAPVTVSEPNRSALIAAGVPAEVFVNERTLSDTFPYFLVRTDLALSDALRMNVRYNMFVLGLRHGGTGQLQTNERSFGYSGYDYALAAQAVTSFSQTFFSESRFQAAKQIVRKIGDDLSGGGPSVNIIGVAGLGPDPALGSVSSRESSIQFHEAITRITGDHSLKLGGGMNFINDRPAGQLGSQYTFSSVAQYVDAASGAHPRNYFNYQESFGDNDIPARALFSDFFVQDEWSLSRRAKLSFGLRYELYGTPKADRAAVLEISRKFHEDGDNFAPRLGLAYLVRDGKYRTVVRFGAGMHYDPPLLNMYRRAILNNGNPRYVTFSLTPGSAGAPEFPNRVGALRPPSDIDAVAPDFETMYAIRSSFQVEQAVSDDMSVTFGYIYSLARHIPVYRNINCLPVAGTLADGRPVYGTINVDQVTGRAQITPCTNKLIPQYNLIKVAESAGNQGYQGGFVQVQKRLSRGVQMSANYTLSRSRDDAPEENVDPQSTPSDPSNRAFDRSRSRTDVTSVFNLSLVARPEFRSRGGFFDTLLNGNQVAVIVIADSGETFNITTGDLNRDGVTGATGPDRPVGVERYAGKLPPFFTMDARYSRFIRLSEKRSLEFYFEATNVLNGKQVSRYDGTSLASSNIYTSPVNPVTGELRVPLPDRSAMLPAWRESRQVQLGAKFHF